MSKPTIWIVSKSAHNYEKAEKYGEIKFICDLYLSPYATGSMYRIIEQALKQSRPIDYILPTGLPIMNAIACSYFTLKHGKLNLLIFKRDKDRMTGESVTSYKEREVMFDSVKEGHKE